MDDFKQFLQETFEKAEKRLLPPPKEKPVKDTDDGMDYLSKKELNRIRYKPKRT